MDYVVIAILLVLVLAAGGYIYKAKKSGKKCIGCPGGCTCGTQKGGCSGCHAGKK